MALQWVARRTSLLTGNQQWLYRAVAFSSSSSTPSSSFPLAAPPAAAVPASSWLSCPPSAELCGRGDKKTQRGKRFKGSYGNARPKLKKKIERIKDKLEVPSVVCLEDAAWCVCRSDVSQSLQQKVLDYACTPILQNGACYNPNTVLAHCSYAANSYFHRKGKAAGSCDFSATATVSATDPSYSGCSYPSSAR